MTERVVDRLKGTQDVIEVGRTHGEAIGHAVDQIVAPFMPRGARPATGALIAGLVGALADSADRLTKAQQALDLELSDDDAPRKTRDELAQKLYDRMVGVRAGVDAACGNKGLRALGVTGNTPRDPVLLLSLTRTVLENSKRVKLVSTQPGVTLDLKHATKDVAALCTELETALGDVRREEKEADAALIARNQAHEALAARRSAVAGLLEELCLAAGMTELSERVRPATRRASASTAGDAGDAGDGSGAGDGGDPGDAGSGTQGAGSGPASTAQAATTATSAGKKKGAK